MELTWLAWKITVKVAKLFIWNNLKFTKFKN